MGEWWDWLYDWFGRDHSRIILLCEILSAVSLVGVLYEVVRDRRSERALRRQREEDLRDIAARRKAEDERNALRDRLNYAASLRPRVGQEDVVISKRAARLLETDELLIDDAFVNEWAPETLAMTTIRGARFSLPGGWSFRLNARSSFQIEDCEFDYSALTPVRDSDNSPLTSGQEAATRPTSSWMTLRRCVIKSLLIEDEYRQVYNAAL